MSAQGMAEGQKLGSRRQTVTSIFEREHNYAKVQRELREADVRRGIARELAECTFEPTLGSGRERRGVKRFLREQLEHSARRERELARIASARESFEQSQVQSGPSISEVVVAAMLA